MSKVVPAKAHVAEFPSSAPILTKRYLLFASWIVISLLLFIRPVVDLIRLSFSQDDASHLVLIPLISAVILYVDRHTIFPNVSTDRILGVGFLLLAGLVALSTHFGKNIPSPRLSGWIFAFVLLWTSGFAFMFGKSALRAASFPLLFLLLMVPMPDFLLNYFIRLLQVGSAGITGFVFDLFRVPALREGLVFHLPRVAIEVAKECSGIRSSMALFILALTAAHFRLKSLGHKVLFVACGLFVMILKNGIRIATLTLLAIYVDPGFLFGRLHREGGVVFFVLALLLLLPLLSFLERRESRRTAEEITT